MVRHKPRSNRHNNQRRRRLRKPSLNAKLKRNVKLHRNAITRVRNVKFVALRNSSGSNRISRFEWNNRHAQRKPNVRLDQRDSNNRKANASRHQHVRNHNSDRNNKRVRSNKRHVLSRNRGR